MDSTTTFLSRDLPRTAALALAMFVGGAGAATIPNALAQGETTIQGCALVAPAVDAEPWVRTELFFGTARPGGREVTEAEWEGFLAKKVTPLFPDGLTVIEGNGQWQGESNEIVHERSKIVILLYPREAIADSNAAIEEIRTAYENQFQQESVLRADDDRPVCTSF